MLARDIMDTRFHTLKPHETVAQAVKMFQTASREEGKKIFGLIVVDDADRLVGMLSMYDILLFIQPKHMKIWGEMEDLEPDRLFEDLLGKVKGIQVGDIMTTEVVTIGPETHILSISDLTIDKHIRRLPVSEDGRIIGMGTYGTPLKPAESIWTTWRRVLLSCWEWTSSRSGNRANSDRRFRRAVCCVIGPCVSWARA